MSTVKLAVEAVEEAKPLATDDIAQVKVDDIEQIKIDDVRIANDISSKLKYEFLTDVLAKPMEKIMVEIEQVEQDPDYYKTITDSKGNAKYRKKRHNIDPTLPEGMKRIKRSVYAVYQYAIVLKLPMSMPTHFDFLRIGDIVMYQGPQGKPFDLFKDSILLPLHAIAGIYTGSSAEINFRS
ncbi:hypothetical protein AGMMS50239_40840 [Bacteroidia bacterium]|nr:hypothetical protein AGMMS50239_40840 [Bacteroidia bacterium]